MEGGIKAWKGLVARGVPEAGMGYFEPARTPEELIALAWLLEEGSRRFYEEMGQSEKAPDPMNLFRDLSRDEEEHKDSLFRLYLDLSGQKPDPAFPRSIVTTEPGMDYLEGGMTLSHALEWGKGEGLGGALELSISLEVNAIDLYVKMERKVEESEAKKVFQVLSNQERRHLTRLSDFLEKRS
jgi:rubrerythrin